MTICRAPCSVLEPFLSRDNIEFINGQGVTVLSGPRCKRSGLWSIDLEATTTRVDTPVAKGLSVRPLPADSVADWIEWWHASLGYPVASTFLRALSSWLKDKIPGVTLKRAQMNKERLKSITSAKGHLNQTRQNARSTQEITRQRSTRNNIIMHLITDQERNDMDIAHLLFDK